MNKPFLLIAGDDYYPQNGIHDWVGRFKTYEEAEDIVEKTYSKPGKAYAVYYKVNGRNVDWYKIVNLETWEPNQ